MDDTCDEVVNDTGQDITSAVLYEEDVSQLLDKIKILLKQRNFEEALENCEKALKNFPDHEQVLEKKIKIFCHQGHFEEAYELAKEWSQKDKQNQTAIKEVRRLKIVMRALTDQDFDEDENQDTDNKITLEEKDTLLIDTPYVQSTDIVDQPELLEHICMFCDVKFASGSELDTHCKSDLHKQKITCDEGYQWDHRPPPRGLNSEEFTLCHRFVNGDWCSFGDNCTQAHSKEELEEWRERFKFRKQQIQTAREKHLHGNTYTEQLMEKLMNPDYPRAVIAREVEYAKIHVNSDLKVNMTNKKCTNAWTFTVTCKRCMNRVALLDENMHSYFFISSISVGPKKTQKYQNLENMCQEWVNPDSHSMAFGEYVYRIKVVFKTDIYGTFRQTLVYDFGQEPVLSREMQVESAPITDAEHLSRYLLLSEQGRWRLKDITLVEFAPKLSVKEEDKQLVTKYCLPTSERFRLSEHLMQPPSKETYRIWMHEMLYIEEMSRLQAISRYNMKVWLQLVNRFLLIPGTLSTAKYAQNGELFARMKLDDDLSEDLSAGKLILQSCITAWLAPLSPEDDTNKNCSQKVYEVGLEDKGKNFIFLRLSATTVSELNLTCDEEFFAQVQFQLNRLSLCEMHAAVDRLPTLDLVFPSLDHTPDLDSKNDRELSDCVDSKLNDKQRNAVLEITSDTSDFVPPVLLVGPFGTGKTYTLAQATMQALEQATNRILICTHSNSAADLYIKDFLHPYVKEGNLEARPLRVYWKQRWIQTVSEVVLQYCLLDNTGSMSSTFRQPLLEDVEKHRIVITTLGTARYLCELDLDPGFFTHIFVDEAVQVIECEILISLSLAGPNTRIVLAGDHMQLNPEVTSDFGRQQGFHKSLLERLYEVYPAQSRYETMLCENYRSHKAIVQFTSELFYENKLVASGQQPGHDTYYPLTFFAAQGEDLQHDNNTGFYNIAEVYEVIDRVEDLISNWQSQWGEINENSIGVVAAYTDQVVRIRSELRKRKMMRVSVENVFNVQGKQFRVIIMSTVRTRHTCRSDTSVEDYIDYGFLSNIKLLNTAITRAQSLVIVVGDPVSLCLVGKCRKVWEHYLDVCNEHGSFHGMPWNQLKTQLNSAEMTKTYVLNPLAPEFIPNQSFHGSIGQNQHQRHSHTGPFPLHWPQSGGHFPVNKKMHQPFYSPYMPYQAFYAPYMPRPYIPNFGASRLFSASRMSHRPTPANILAKPAVKETEKSTSEDQKTGQPLHAARRSAHVQQRTRLIYMPRMPMTYNPYILYPSHHYQNPYFMPEDPRMLPFHPYGPRFPHSPYMGQPVYAVPHYGNYPNEMAAGINSAFTEGSTVVGAQGFGKMEKDKHMSNSPAVSSSQAAKGQQIKLLPNVKHVPVHLRESPVSAATCSSQSSTPVNAASPVSLQLSPQSSVDDEKNSSDSELSAAQGKALVIPSLYDRRTRTNSPLSRQHFSTKHKLTQKEVDTKTRDSPASLSSSDSPSPDSGYGAPRSEVTVDLPKSKMSATVKQLQLKLPTGFSRQFSDDLETPTEITDLVRMIEESIEEKDENEETDSPLDENRVKSEASSGRLYLNLPLHNRSESPNSPLSSSPSSQGDQRPTYAGMVRRRLPSCSPTSHDIDPNALEPQTPRTPAGFVTPNADIDIDTDALGLLKNLNINGTASNQKVYQYFS